jgi:hypothetical protein
VGPSIYYLWPHPANVDGRSSQGLVARENRQSVGSWPKNSRIRGK